MLLAGQVAGNSHAETGRNRSRGVGGSEAVVFALGTLCETRQATAGPQGPDAVAPPSQDFVRICLMTDIPDQFVFRRIKNVMQRYGQFDHAETSAQVTAGDSYGVDCFR